MRTGLSCDHTEWLKSKPQADMHKAMTARKWVSEEKFGTDVSFAKRGAIALDSENSLFKKAIG
jgi:hypothetical protein